jgi:hypothetical protein
MEPAVDCVPHRSKAMPETELTPIAHHLFKAAEMIRQLQVAELEREKLYTNVYQLVCSALDLIVTDEMRGKPDPKRNPETAQKLRRDLKDLFGE